MKKQKTAEGKCEVNSRKDAAEWRDREVNKVLRRKEKRSVLKRRHCRLNVV